MKKLFLCAIPDLPTGVAESAFDLYIEDDTVIIESDYYHSDIQECLGDYAETVEAELFNWLQNNLHIADGEGVVNIAYDCTDKFTFHIVDINLTKESEND